MKGHPPHLLADLRENWREEASSGNAMCAAGPVGKPYFTHERKKEWSGTCFIEMRLKGRAYGAIVRPMAHDGRFSGLCYSGKTFFGRLFVGGHSRTSMTREAPEAA